MLHESDDTADSGTTFESRPCRHKDMDASSLGLYEARTSGGGWSRHLSWLAIHSKFSFAIAGSLHVSEFVGSFLADIVETTGDHHFCISRQQGIAGNLDGL